MEFSFQLNEFWKYLQISAHVAQRRPDRIAGIIMCGPAFNCIIPGYWFNYNMLEEDVKKLIDEGKHHMQVKVK